MFSTIPSCSMTGSSEAWGPDAGEAESDIGAKERVRKKSLRGHEGAEHTVRNAAKKITPDGDPG
jgi:hypothetical protein